VFGAENCALSLCFVVDGWFGGWAIFQQCHAVIYANQCCKKKGINMSTFSGVFEMWAMVFKFEHKKLSFIMLTATYGGALMIVAIFVLTLWGQSKGCVFPINDRTMR
jgi:hypothetical protein